VQPNPTVTPRKAPREEFVRKGSSPHWFCFVVERWHVIRTWAENEIQELSVLEIEPVDFFYGPVEHQQRRIIGQ
jgi:hypothetical protein